MSSPPHTAPPTLKARAASELKELAVLTAYLFLCIEGFALYRRLILDEYQISYVGLGAGLIGALLLAKFIMLGDILRVGRRAQNRTHDRPLIVSTLLTTLIFMVFVTILLFIEEAVVGLVKGKGFGTVYHELRTTNPYELAARILLMFLAFLPLFVIRALAELIGEEKLHKLFFRRPA